MTEDRFDLIFEECLRQIRGGVPLDQVLKAYPRYEARLRPLLETAVLASSLNSAPTIPASARAKSKNAFLEALASAPRAVPWYSPAVLLRSAWSTAVFLFILTAGLVWTGLVSAESLPGDSLYPLKITAERTRLLIASNPSQRLQLENEYDQERADEVEALFGQNRHTEVTFAGFLSRSTSGTWLVNQVPIVFPGSISQKIIFQDGDNVDVHGAQLSDGTVMVEWIQFKTTQFNGRINSISTAEWVVSGIHVQVNAETRLIGDPKVGSLVGIDAAQRANQVLVARSITVKTVWQDLLDRVPRNQNEDEMVTSEPEIRGASGTETVPSVSGGEKPNPGPGDGEIHSVENTARPSNTPEVETHPTKNPTSTQESEHVGPTRTSKPDDGHAVTRTPKSTPMPTWGEEQHPTSTPRQEEEHSSRSPTPQNTPTPANSPTPKPDSDH